MASRHALVLPLGQQTFRIAVVEGKTPFLISNTFLKGLKAIIDTDEETLYSKVSSRYLQLTRSIKNLFLMDINQLWDDEMNVDHTAQVQRPDEHLSMHSEVKIEPSQDVITEAEGLTHDMVGVGPKVHNPMCQTSKTSECVHENSSLAGDSMFQPMQQVRKKIRHPTVRPTNLVLFRSMALTQKLKMYRANSEENSAEDQLQAV